MGALIQNNISAFNVPVSVVENVYLGCGLTPDHQPVGVRATPYEAGTIQNLYVVVTPFANYSFIPAVPVSEESIIIKFSM